MFQSCFAAASAENRQDNDINSLNILHVAGTKGKGSTCAFMNSFLSVHSERVGFPRKVGFYSSPHLIYPEERIRIDSAPIRRSLFAKYFFEVYEALSLDDPEVPGAKPRYLQLFLLVALHTFVREGVDAAILETHHGGEYDATNVVQRPIATAIATLGMDHVAQLGPTIENIAWHKAGIFKHGAGAFSVPQDSRAAKVLRERAVEKDVNLHFVQQDPSPEVNETTVKPKVQLLNCSLALAMTRYFLSEKSPSKDPLLDCDVRKGIDSFSWPGRFQEIHQRPLHWYLDGAHNEMSVVESASWFIEKANEEM
jgi:folylpolyglutamate synthase